jgi:TatA/E family protein of Tat protein translocase
MNSIVSQFAFLSGVPGHMELLLLFVLVLLLFGPRKLPDIAKTIGRTISDLRRASQDFRDQVMSIDEDVEDDACEEPADQEDDKEKPDEPRT